MNCRNIKYIQKQYSNNLFYRISTTATVELGELMLFKHMNFNGHEFFRTVSDSYFKQGSSI